MASNIENIIEKVGSGSLTPEKAGQQISTIVKGGEPLPELGSEEDKDRLFSRMADKDDSGYEESFNVVVAAWVSGDLTDGQYHTIRDIVTMDSGGQTAEEDDDSDDE